MKVLVVEDDQFKLRQVCDHLLYLRDDLSITTASSLHEAVARLYSESFAAVILDMAIPSHSSRNGASDVYSQPVGGLDILLYLSFGKRAERVMILTQYPTIEYNRSHVALSKFASRLAADKVFNVDDVVLFSEDGAWQSRLDKFVGALA